MLQDGVDLRNDWVIPYLLANCALCGACLDLGKETLAFDEYEGAMYCKGHSSVD